MGLFVFLFTGTATDDIVNGLEKYKHGDFYLADDEGRLRQPVALVSYIL